MLPMSTCTHYVDKEGMRVFVEEGKPLPEGVSERFSYNYALEGFGPLEPGLWVRAFAFVWPALGVVVLHWRKRGAIVGCVRILELPLIVGSFYLVDFISTFLGDRRSFGAYVAFVALGTYALGALWADVALYRERRQRRGTRQGAATDMPQRKPNSDL
jgi:hypothetical protein